MRYVPPAIHSISVSGRMSNSDLLGKDASMGTSARKSLAIRSAGSSAGPHYQSFIDNIGSAKRLMATTDGGPNNEDMTTVTIDDAKLAKQIAERAAAIPSLWRRTVAEAIGTFWLVLGGC